MRFSAREHSGGEDICLDESLTDDRAQQQLSKDEQALLQVHRDWKKHAERRGWLRFFKGEEEASKLGENLERSSARTRSENLSARWFLRRTSFWKGSECQGMWYSVSRMMRSFGCG